MAGLFLDILQSIFGNSERKKEGKSHMDTNFNLSLAQSSDGEHLVSYYFCHYYAHTFADAWSIQIQVTSGWYQLPHQKLLRQHSDLKEHFHLEELLKITLCGFTRTRIHHT